MTCKLFYHCAYNSFLDGEHGILESSNQDDISPSGSSVCIDGDWGELPEYHTLEGPEEPNDNQGQERFFAERDIMELSGKLLSLQRSFSEGDIMKAYRKELSLRGSFSERDITKP